MNKITNHNFSNLRGVLGLLVLSALVAGCATSNGAQNQPVSLEDRAQARWDHLLANQSAEAYQYLSPGYRSSVSLGAYQNQIAQKKVNWTGAQVLDSECSELSCKVRVMLNYRLFGAVPGVQQFDGKQLVTESWVNSDGQWWHIPPN